MPTHKRSSSTSSTDEYIENVPPHKKPATPAGKQGAGKAAVKPKVSFAHRMKEVKKLHSNLKKSIRQSRGDWDEQYELQAEISSEINDWVQEMFQVAMEKQEQFKDVQAAMESVYSEWDATVNCGAREPYEEECEERFEVSSASHGTVYSSRRLRRVLLQFWRDSVLAALDEGSDGSIKVVDAAVAHWKEKKLDGLIAGLLRSSEERSEEDEELLRDAVGDSWHSEAIQAVIPDLKKRLEGGKVISATRDEDEAARLRNLYRRA